MYRNLMQVLLAKEESVYGSDPTPTVADNAIQAENIKIDYKGDVHERNYNRSNLSPVAPVIGKRWIEISFDVEIKGSGSAGTAPKLGDLLEACGFSEAVSVGSSVTYTPSSGTMKSITVYVYDIPDTGSARLHKVTGARGEVGFELTAGQIAKAKFKFQGIYNAVTDIAAPSAPTFESSIPPIVQSASFTLNAITTLVVQAMNIDMGNDVIQSDDISSSGGLSKVLISSRKPAGKFAPEAVTVATYGYWADWIAATQRALSVVVGTAAGNKCTISAPKVTIDNISEAERNNIRTDEIAFRCSGNSGNDEISLVFA